jgi:P27 family predicted phage terminase small subunit
LPREARAEWRRVVKACAAWPTWLQTVDRAALSAYCTAWATFQAAAKDVAERGPLVPGRSSADQARPALVKNPAVQVVRDAQQALRQWARELGFTPDARGRVDLGDREDHDAGRGDPNRLLS